MAVETAPTDEVVIAIDMGGTLVKAALAAPDGALSAQVVQPTGAGDGPDAVLDGLGRVVSNLVATAEHTGVAVRAVAVAAPGLVDSPNGVVTSAVNLGWRQVPLAALLEERCGAPVQLFHDVRMAALAEGRIGAAAASRDYVVITIGTGIGGAAVSDGELHGGAHHRALELGHLRVAGSTAACACGRTGCLEAVASCSALERRYAAASGHHVAVAEVVARAAAGDRDARIVWDGAVAALGAALDHAIVLLDPDLVLLGGGLSAIPSDLVARLTAHVAATLPWRPAPAVGLAALGAWAGCAGAALQLWDMVSERSAATLPALGVTA